MEKYIDVRGRKGVDGQNGRNGRDGCGEDGAHAGPSTPGENGGTAYLRLAREPNDPAMIIISGTLNGGPY